MRKVILKNNGANEFWLTFKNRKLGVPPGDEMDLRDKLTLYEIMEASEQIETALNDIGLSITINDGANDLTLAQAVDYITPSFKVMPTATASGLVITVNVGASIVNDQTTVTADSSLTKTFQVTLVKISGAFAVEVREKTTGEYGSLVGSLVEHIKEFNKEAKGSYYLEAIENQKRSTTQF